MQTRPQNQDTEREPEAEERPELQLDVQVLEDRIAPSLFAYSSTTSLTNTLDVSQFINWGEPFHP